MDFSQAMQKVSEYQAYSAQANPPEGVNHFGQYLLDQGFTLTEFDEDTWRGVAEALVEKEAKASGLPLEVLREVWLEELAGLIGQPYYEV